MGEKPDDSAWKEDVDRGREYNARREAEERQALEERKRIRALPPTPVDQPDWEDVVRRAEQGVEDDETKERHLDLLDIEGPE